MWWYVRPVLRYVELDDAVYWGVRQGRCTRALYTLGERTTTDMGARGRQINWAGKSGGGKLGRGDILLVLG